MKYDQVADAVEQCWLEVLGAFLTPDEDGFLEAGGTLFLIGSGRTGYWEHLQDQPEFVDGSPDPLDRWSRRVISNLSAALGGNAYFPFGGPPHLPFQRWATKSERCWQSPVGLLVHDTRGLFISFRGAVMIPSSIDLPPASSRPCDNCAERPCLSSCPVDALNGTGFDTGRCAGYIASDGCDCLNHGCAVRRSCPFSPTETISSEQHHFHQQAFLNR